MTREGLTVLIPARGGSKGIPDKNLRLINGVPLVIHAARIAGQVGVPVVSTEDPTIAAVCRTHGIDVLDRPKRLATDEATVDELVTYLLDNHHVDYPLLVVQPTVPEITVSDLNQFIDHMDSLGHHAGVLGVPFNHILWHDGKISPRVNRQDLLGADIPAREIGVRYYRDGNMGSGINIGSVMYTLGRDVTDIDTFDDLATARRRLEERTVVFDFTADEQIGWGHKTRCETLASELSHHYVQFERNGPYPLTGPGVWVFDRLDTTVDMVAGAAANGWKTLCLEDRGPGARHADAIVNALYPIGHLPQEHSGPDWVVLRPEFQGLPPRDYHPKGRVLVTFGGTDPASLTDRVLWNLRNESFTVDVIEPPGRGGKGVPSMAAAMRGADLVITSAGRTLYEAAATGTPAISLAVNARETGHAHLGVGNLYLGHHATVSDSALKRTVTNLMVDQTLREDLGLQGKQSIDGKGTQRLVHLIEGLML